MSLLAHVEGLIAGESVDNPDDGLDDAIEAPMGTRSNGTISDAARL
jgi:hypothetical protein